MQHTASAQQQEYRAIIVDENWRQVLVARGKAGFSLAGGGVGDGDRVAERLTQELAQRWHCQAACLFSVESEPSHDITVPRYEVLECCGLTSISGLEWVPLDSLKETSFLDSRDYLAVQQSKRARFKYANSAAYPFAQTGWHRELKNWVEAHLLPRELQLRAGFLQLNGSASFSLVRFATSGPAVWFKAVGKPNEHECAITQALAPLFPEFVPELIAVRPDWNGWLSMEADGVGLNSTRAIGAWESAAASLARLQVQSLYNLSPFRGLVRSMTAETLSKALKPFFNTIRRLMKDQRKTPPPCLTDIQLAELEMCIQECLGRLRGMQVSDSLGNLDLNPANIIHSQAGCRFLDWAEAYIGIPSLSIQYLVEFARAFSDEPSNEDRLYAAYVNEWRVAGWDIAEEVLSITPLLAAFAYAVSYSISESTQPNPQSQAYLRALTRRMAKEANRLLKQGCLC